MSDEKKGPEYAEARQSLRDTFKWLVGITSAVGAALATGISFTALGRLEGVELGMAIVAGMVALVGLMLGIGELLSVMLRRPYTLTDIVRSKEMDMRLLHYGIYPKGMSSIEEVTLYRDRCIEQLQIDPSRADISGKLKDCDEFIAKAVDLAAFLDLSDRCNSVLRQLALWVAVVAVSTATIGLLIGRQAMAS